MPLDTAKIDAQIRKLQELRRIAGDPEMAPLLESLIVQNGLPAKAKKAPRKARARSMEATNPIKRGDVVTAASKALAGISGKFAASNALEAMEKNGFVFSAETPIVAVNGALRRLLKRGEIRLAEAGSGRKPHLYERVGRASGD